MNNLYYTNLLNYHLSLPPLNHLVHQLSTAIYVQPATRAIIFTDHSNHPPPTISPMIHRPVPLPVDYDIEEETAIIRGTDEYQTYRSESYNQPTYDENLELEEQMGRGDYREETAIIGAAYDYQPYDNNEPTYEENLELEERLGRVGSRLSEETIMGHLKITSYDATSKRMDEEADICVICQGEYEKDELIGGLHCGHDYHVECVKKWLKQHNSCPICKADAVSPNAY